jgi:hypothetical protein
MKFSLPVSNPEYKQTLVWANLDVQNWVGPILPGPLIRICIDLTFDLFPVEEMKGVLCCNNSHLKRLQHIT